MKKDLMGRVIDEKVKIDFSFSDIENKIDFKKNILLENNKIKMQRFIKSNIHISMKITKRVLALSVLVLIVSAFLIVSVLNNRLVFDFEMGKIAYNKVNNAQYVPDLDQFITVNTRNNKLSKNKMTTDEFYELIDEYSEFNNYSGSGKYLGYDIYEVKKEITYVLEHIPAFNQWFTLPAMIAENGYVAVPYNSRWSYHMDLDEENDVLTITRVCVETRSSYLDFENKVSVEEYDNGGLRILNKGFSQYEIMEIKYYHNEENDEVVECTGYSFGVDNVMKYLDSFNDNSDDYYPFEYMYLQNIKDKSLIKYHITAAERYRSEESFDEGGMDIRGLFPYGSTREFLVANYEGYNDIDVMKIRQELVTDLRLEAKSKMDFAIDDELFILLMNNFNISQTEILSLASKEQALDILCKTIIDNFELANNVVSIIENKYNAVKLADSDFYGVHKGSSLPIRFMNSYADPNRDGTIDYDCSANTYDKKIFLDGELYSLCPALKNENGDVYILGTDYKKCSVSKFEVLFDGSSLLGSDIKTISFNELCIDEPGEYVLTTVLTRKVNNEDVIIFDTQETVYVRGNIAYQVIEYTDQYGLGYICDVREIGKELKIKISIKPFDSQKG